MQGLIIEHSLVSLEYMRSAFVSLCQRFSIVAGREPQRPERRISAPSEAR